MKTTPFLSLLVSASLLTAVAQDQPAPAPAQDQPAPAETPKEMTAKDIETMSFLMGYQQGAMMTQDSPASALIKENELNMDSFRKGILSGIQGLSPEEMNIDPAAIQQTFSTIESVLQARYNELAQANLELSKKFMEENKTKEGVQTTESGLQYIVLEKGGDKKFDEKKFKNPLFNVKYTGTTIDGKVFDKSGDTPVELPLRLIPGFTEALKSMPIGAKWKIFIPAALAYGEQSPSPRIQPNSALIFEIELIDIKEAPAPEAGQGGQISPEMLEQLMKSQGQ